MQLILTHRCHLTGPNSEDQESYEYAPPKVCRVEPIRTQSVFCSSAQTIDSPGDFVLDRFVQPVCLLFPGHTVVKGGRGATR